VAAADNWVYSRLFVSTLLCVAWANRPSRSQCRDRDWPSEIVDIYSLPRSQPQFSHTHFPSLPSSHTVPSTQLHTHLLFSHGHQSCLQTRASSTSFASSFKFTQSPHQLSKEYITMQREPPPFVWAAPEEKDILTCAPIHPHLHPHCSHTA
jgi:hypothetical protein